MTLEDIPRQSTLKLTRRILLSPIISHYYMMGLGNPIKKEGVTVERDEFTVDS